MLITYVINGSKLTYVSTLIFNYKRLVIITLHIQEIKYLNFAHAKNCQHRLLEYGRAWPFTCPFLIEQKNVSFNKCLRQIGLGNIPIFTCDTIYFSYRYSRYSQSKICHTQVQAKTGNTFNLLSHLKKKHTHVYKELKAKMEYKEREKHASKIQMKMKRTKRIAVRR